MKQVLSAGDHTIMLHQGQLAVDIKGEPRSKMDIQDLINLFHQNHVSQDSELGDALLLS